MFVSWQSRSQRGGPNPGVPGVIVPDGASPEGAGDDVPPPPLLPPPPAAATAAAAAPPPTIASRIAHFLADLDPFATGAALVCVIVTVALSPRNEPTARISNCPTWLLGRRPRATALPDASV